jgi:hypothetical protein
MDGDVQAGRQLIGGAHSQSMADVRSRISVDTTELGKLKKHLDEIHKSAKGLREEFDALVVSAGKASTAIKGMQGPGGSGSGGYINNDIDVTAPDKVKTAGGGANIPPAGGGGGAAAAAGGRAAGFAAFATALAPAIQAGVSSLDNRISRGTAYATSADRLNVLMQQMYGMSQMDVMQRMRQPLAGSRLGEGGINAMMAFQTQTGMQMNAGMARSIEGIRTATGFTKTTQDILAEQQQLLNPEVANRMLYTLGVNAYNFGGGMADPLKTRQDIIRNMGLSDPNVLRGALSPGSVTRFRMSQAGIGEEMQTEILQYAQQNVQFREKGGKGFYDPSKKSDRVLMGVEGNLATQQEETNRVQTQREEQFMERQIDNMATREKIDQQLIQVLAKLEDTLSGAIGARTSGQSLMRMGGNLIKIAAPIIGSMIAPGVGTAAGFAIGQAVGGAMTGDGKEGDNTGATSTSRSGNSSGANDASTFVPYGYNGARISLSELKQKPDFQKLNSRFRDRLLNMMRANPNIGVGGGYRDSGSQRTMFLDRYEVTDEETDIFWEGKYWKKVKGADAAPPGQSMHEIGLAADLVGDLAWMNANASRFGLQHFANVNNEPWHVQPDDLPRSRRQYEEQGAPWGTDGGYDSNSTYGRSTNSAQTVDSHDGAFDNILEGMSTAGMTTAEILEAIHAGGMARLMAGSAAGSGTTTGTQSSAKGSSTDRLTGSQTPLTREQVARYAANAGFSGEALVHAVAIAFRESHGVPGALNPDSSTGDNSFGLMQINMIGNLEASRLASFGISKKEDLYDPQKNMDAAFQLYSGRNNTFYDWGPYKGMDHLYDTDVGAAEAAVKSAGLYSSGDPMEGVRRMPSRRSSSRGNSGSNGTTMHISSSPTITVAPVINFTGTPQTQDLRNIAQTVGRLLKEEVEKVDLRTA